MTGTKRGEKNNETEENKIKKLSVNAKRIYSYNCFTTDYESNFKLYKQSNMSKAIVSTDFTFPGLKSVYKGKVRDVYNIQNEYLVMIV